MILIIGAGLGGLSLARYLQAQTIPFRIFDQAPAQRPQGYGLTLKQETIDELMPVINMSEPDFKTAVSVDRKTGAMATSLMNIKTGQSLGAGAFKPEAAKNFRTNRRRLRLTVQGDVQVDYNHKLVAIIPADDHVVARFQNGVEVAGDFLVAADGVHSFVRNTLIPHIKPEPFLGIMYNGTRKMSRRDFNATISPAMGGLNVKPGVGDSLILAATIYDVDPDEDTVSISWGYTRPSTGKGDPLWAPYSRDHVPSFAPPQLWEEFAQLPHPLVEPYRSIFGDPVVKDDGILHQLLVNMLIPRGDLMKVLREKRVIFIGDAAHAWSNHAGTGGNNAILDGLGLGKMISEGKSPEDFYDQAYARWQENIDTNAKSFEDMIKPLAEWERLMEAQKQS